MKKLLLSSGVILICIVFYFILPELLMGLLGVLLIGISIFLYFLPTIIADNNKHTALVGILIVNIIAGWTLFGWVICLIWAYSQNKKDSLPIREENTVSKLEKLHNLLEKDLISKEEFHKLKKDLMKS